MFVKSPINYSSTFILQSDVGRKFCFVSDQTCVHECVCGGGRRLVYAHELRFLFSGNKNCLPLKKKKTIMIFMMSK